MMILSVTRSIIERMTRTESESDPAGPNRAGEKIENLRVDEKKIIRQRVPLYH